MANYVALSRTNYFNVSDIEKMKEFCMENGFHFWKENGSERYAFDSDEPIFYDEIIPQVQELLDENDICVIMEIGSEAKKYLVGGATLITKNNVEYIILSDIINDKINLMNLPDDVKKNFKIEY